MILIPTIYGRYSLDGIADLFRSIEDVKESSDFKYMILRNTRDSRNKLSNVFVEEQLEPYKENLLKTVIRRNEAINQAQMNNEPVMGFGCTTPDNNLAENAIRPFCVGRRNWLFAETPDGAQTSATIFSLIESAKANQLEPCKYLRYLF